MKEFTASEKCKKCKGKCCQWYPGAYVPQDFSDIETELLDLLSSDNLKIDYYEHYEDFELVKSSYFPRPKSKSNRLTNECQHLTDSGCALPRNKRPSQCKTLEPGDKCIQHMRYAWKLWEDYQDLLQLLIELGE